MKVTPHYSTQETLQFTYDSVLGILQSNIPGCLVECGVASGSQIGAMQECLQAHGAKREIYGFDSFCGIPYAGERDTQQPGIGPVDENKLGLLETTGVSAHSKECVLSNFEKWSLKTNHLTLIEGWFENTVPLANTGPIAMLRLDGDLYSSTKVCMEHLYPLLVPNGILIIDDYSLQGCRDAIHEYIPEGEIINIYGIAYYIKK
jgi:hypothetical protein